MLPCFRIMAVSMQRLHIRRARIAVIAIDMVHLDAVVMLEKQPTVTTPTSLRFASPGQCGTDHGMPSLSCAPVHPIAVVGTTMALDVDMPCHRDLAVRPKSRRFRVARRGSTGQAGAPPMPVTPRDPANRFTRMSPACPGSERDPEAMIEPMIHGLTHTGAVGSGPTPDCGVELANQRPLGEGSTAFDNSPTRRQMVLHLSLGGFDQGVVPQTLLASGAFPRLVFAHPILPDVTPQERQPRVIAFQGMAHATFSLVQTSSHLGQPRLEKLSDVFTHLAILVQHHALIGVGDNPRARGELGNRLLHSRQGNQRQQRGTTPALWRPSWGWTQVLLFQDPRLEPGFEWSAKAGGGLHFGQQGLMVDSIAAFGNIDFERILRSIPNRRTDRSDGIVTGPSRAEAISMGGALGFPCGFKGLTNQGLSSPIRLGRKAKGAFVRAGAPFGHPDAPECTSLAVETKLVG